MKSYRDLEVYKESKRLAIERNRKQVTGNRKHFLILSNDENNNCIDNSNLPDGIVQVNKKNTDSNIQKRYSTCSAGFTRSFKRRFGRIYPANC